MMLNKFKFYLPVVLLLGSIALVAMAGDARYFIPGGAQRTTNTDYVVPVITNPSTGCLTPDDAEVSISQHSAVQVPTLPAGTKRFRLYVQPGAGANWGPSNVASGTSFPEIASATLSDYFYVGTTTPTVYFIGRTAAATGTVICE
ncbi:MAG: hypothetical protein AB1403_00685 [Candidatus Riflebacteria bacterium]